VTGINFALQASSELLDRVADAVVAGVIAAPPITRITLNEAPAVLKQAATGHANGKTVITL
jgi:NADPH:quinone reductase-like Zn-dependent oxidoreductase